MLTMTFFGFKRLEYSFIMQTCNFGTETRMGKNPFTGENVEFHIDRGLSIDEAQRLKLRLGTLGFKGPEPEGEGYVLNTGLRQNIRILCHDIEPGLRGLEVEIVAKKLTERLITAAMEIAEVGNFAIMTPVGDSVCVIKRDISIELLERWPDVKQITSAFEMKSWLEHAVGKREVKASL